MLYAIGLTTHNHLEILFIDLDTFQIKNKIIHQKPHRIYEGKIIYINKNKVSILGKNKNETCLEIDCIRIHDYYKDHIVYTKKDYEHEIQTPEFKKPIRDVGIFDSNFNLYTCNIISNKESKYEDCEYLQLDLPKRVNNDVYICEPMNYMIYWKNMSRKSPIYIDEFGFEKRGEFCVYSDDEEIIVLQDGHNLVIYDKYRVKQLLLNDKQYELFFIERLYELSDFPKGVLEKINRYISHIPSALLTVE